MRFRIRLTAMIALASLAVTIASRAPVFAQASSSTAELRGQVTDANGAAIPNAKLTLTDLVKGSSRVATSDGEGNYAFLGLLPSSYDLKVEAQGFSASATRLELTVGQQANIPIKLSTGKIEVQVDVVGGAEVVEVNRTEQSSMVDSKQITSLPINRRNYLDYALLTPGVTSSENISDATDYRVVQTPQSRLSFGGNNGRGNQVAVDGAETISASGAVQAMVSQEAVQEFQVVRNSYSAEFGGASGGTINIISKSGGNSLHGSMFGYFRDQRFDARNAFDYNPKGKSPFNRQEYGGSVGGPIARDKTFFFTSIERLSQEKTSFINLLTDPHALRSDRRIAKRHCPPAGGALRFHRRERRARRFEGGRRAVARGLDDDQLSANRQALYRRVRTISVRRGPDAVLRAARSQLQRPFERLSALQPNRRRLRESGRRIAAHCLAREQGRRFQRRSDGFSQLPVQSHDLE